MDPITQSILLGVASNALTTLVGTIGKAGKRLLSKSADSKNQGVASPGGSAQFEKLLTNKELQALLSLPSAGVIFRQIYSARLMNSEPEVLDGIRRELKALLALNSGKKESELEELSEDVFASFVELCDEILNDLVSHEANLSPEALPISSRKRMESEVTSVHRNLHLLSSGPNLGDILAFESKLLRQISLWHSHIIPPYMDAVRRVPISQIYVPPDILQSSPSKEAREVISLENFASSLYRAVLLGNPGGGKSTLATKIIHDLADRRKEVGAFRRPTIPILVILRDYGSERKRSSCSIVDFMELVSRAKYQIEPPHSAFDYLLLNGHAFVVLDGLDELLETSYRQEISSAVEAFCNLYPSVPVLVTSREVGYEQAPLDGDIFSIFRLAPFRAEQAKDYARKWFKLDTDLPLERREKRADSFFRESDSVADLRSNPLMLALMCNIYRGENYIPKNRPDLYEKCALMLFERWDKSREISVSLPFEAHVRPAMMYLAHKIYLASDLQGGVTEARLISETADYLSARRFEDRDEAVSAARAFVEFCRGRAWVFTDTGTTREGERLYQFTHRTFLEYFTAAYLVRTHAKPAELSIVLLPRVSAREWDVVSQLAFQIQNKNTEGAGDELIAALLDSGELDFAITWNRLSFAARCLHFMVPSPRVTRRVANRCIAQTVEAGYNVRETILKEQIAYGELVEGILLATEENRPVVADALKSQLGAMIAGSCPRAYK
jgi:hypothetical protein